MSGNSRGGRIRRAGGLAVALLFVPILAVVAVAGGGQSALSAARDATAAFHNRETANAAGYSVRVADLAGITCIASAAGAMGVHYLNPALAPELFDPTVVPTLDARTPELLVYEPGPNGQLNLVALEYLTLKANWDARHAGPPSLFGRTFDSTPAGNRYGLPAFYSLHAWIFDHNPASIFAPYNTKVSCP
jgi:hypothetical protein